MWEKLLQWDRATLIYLNGLGNAHYDGFWSMVTKFPTWTPFFLLMLVAFFLKHPKRHALVQILFLLLVAGCIGILSNFTKEWVGRLRPCNDPEINTMIRVLRRPSDFSFFSGHASTSFSVIILAYLFLRKRWKWSFMLFIWPLLFSYSRIYLGVHFPLDIMAGAAMGGLFALLFYRFYLKIVRRDSLSTHP
ncbi:MAG: phosphatase PAP2 family protein [Bacteroidota bacterium]